MDGSNGCKGCAPPGPGPTKRCGQAGGSTAHIKQQCTQKWDAKCLLPEQAPIARCRCEWLPFLTRVHLSMACWSAHPHLEAAQRVEHAPVATQTNHLVSGRAGQSRLSMRVCKLGLKGQLGPLHQSAGCAMRIAG